MSISSTPKLVTVTKSQYKITQEWIGDDSAYANPYTIKQFKAKYPNKHQMDLEDMVLNAYKKHLWALIESGQIPIKELIQLQDETLAQEEKDFHGPIVINAIMWACTPPWE